MGWSNLVVDVAGEEDNENDDGRRERILVARGDEVKEDAEEMRLGKGGVKR